MQQRISISSTCFKGAGLERQVRYWRQLDAHAVSLSNRQIVDDGIDAIQRGLAQAGVRLESIVHTFLPGQNLNPDPRSWETPRANLKASIEAARTLGARSIYMTTGGHGGMVWEEAAETFARAIAPCVENANAVGLPLMVENAPFHNADLHIAHSLRDTLTLAEIAGIGVCIDLFGCWFEADLHNLIKQAVPRCHLVQVSDYLCGDRSPAARAIPGTGNIPLERLLGWILDDGYSGMFDIELFGPRIDYLGQLESTRLACAEITRLLEHLDR